MARTKNLSRKVRIKCVGPVTFRPGTQRVEAAAGDERGETSVPVEVQSMDELLARIEALELNDSIQDKALEILLANANEGDESDDDEAPADFEPLDEGDGFEG